MIDGEGRVLLIRARNRRGRSVWSFPKGRLEAGEDRLEAALREVREETGYRCAARRLLPRTTYWFRSGTTRIKKTVHWFLLAPLSRDGVHDPAEVEEVRWVPIDEAYHRLSYRVDKKLLSTVENVVQRGPRT